MDRTKEYRACIRAIQSFPCTQQIRKPDSLLAVSSRKLETKARQIQNAIRTIAEVLHKNRDSITNFSPYRSTSLKTSDFEVIDQKITMSIDNCFKMIDEFAGNIIGDSDQSDQEIAYYQKVVEFLRIYLRRICTEFYAQKSQRVKRSMQLYELTKLSRKQTDGYVAYRNEQAGRMDDDDRNDSGDDCDGNTQQLTQEELQIIEQENQLLFQDLNSYANEVEQLESQVVEIARLQQALTENILEQDETVDRVAGSVFGLNANICEGNELIRDGIRRDASFRFWLIFFLFVLSLTILFLNWYND